ncbi:Protein UBASH3A -like protein [Toxocara canis]|uniref:Protein UBASH3A-like protein n=1 Tax=Toxocara canis TaxID=6265 RepID=A0A0B2VQM4_TOXCA|nr:Protein UBASH3A -like protein [Toxocara canis]
MAPYPATADALERRTIWVVRHGQRIDNIDKTWKLHAPRGAWDDPPLTCRGKQQAKECGERLARERIDVIVCSPFVRCVETASGISSAHPRHPPIYIEPGICESLNVCQDPPGYLTAAQLREDFPAVDTTYTPIVPNPQPEMNEIACKQRVTEVVYQTLRHFEGDVLFVSHGSPIAMLHEVLTGNWHYVGQCTISKFVSNEQGIFDVILQGDSTHLSDRSNLREREIQRPKV